jgi:hypothetical protein
MDVRAKQRLCYHVLWFLSACALAVSQHVHCAVKLILQFSSQSFSETKARRLQKRQLSLK